MDWIASLRACEVFPRGWQVIIEAAHGEVRGGAIYGLPSLDCAKEDYRAIFVITAKLDA